MQGNKPVSAYKETWMQENGLYKETWMQENGLYKETLQENGLYKETWMQEKGLQGNLNARIRTKLLPSFKSQLLWVTLYVSWFLIDVKLISESVHFILSTTVLYRLQTVF